MRGGWRPLYLLSLLVPMHDTDILTKKYSAVTRGEQKICSLERPVTKSCVVTRLEITVPLVKVTRSCQRVFVPQSTNDPMMHPKCSAVTRGEQKIRSLAFCISSHVAK